MQQLNHPSGWCQPQVKLPSCVIFLAYVANACVDLFSDLSVLQTITIWHSLKRRFCNLPPGYLTPIFIFFLFAMCRVATAILQQESPSKSWASLTRPLLATKRPLRLHRITCWPTTTSPTSGRTRCAQNPRFCITACTFLCCLSGLSFWDS